MADGMRQYCEYCAFLFAGNGIYCDMHNKEMKESTAKTVNNCKDFCYVPTSAFDLDKTYKPRGAYKRSEYKQMTINELMGGET